MVVPKDRRVSSTRKQGKKLEGKIPNNKKKDEKANSKEKNRIYETTSGIDRDGEAEMKKRGNDLLLDRLINLCC